ncbi:MAG: hypothetical protein K0S41_1419 [Anaerocolumna sp.]|jgi:hypothetical protein|nr:hypothetical protein [Anaerocolumna sp.]
MRNKGKRLLLIANVTITIILGIGLLQISNLMYRYNRLTVWTTQNDITNQFYMDLKSIMLIIWIIWGVLIVVSIIPFILDLRKRGR